MSGIRLWSTCPDCHKDYPLETGHRTEECRARCRHGRLPIDPCVFCDGIDICAYCGHDINHHGTTQVGCADCACGLDPDFHPDPPRGDE